MESGRTEFSGCLLVLAGPASLELVSDVSAICRSERNIVWLGPVLGRDKWSLLSAARVFILPSFSEGLSMAVLEALSSGIPVIVSNRCNIDEVESVGAGWVISPTVGEIVTALTAALTEGDDKWRNRSENASALAKRYSPLSVCTKVAALQDQHSNG